MQIKRVEILGFKSFVDCTVLELQDGTSAVVGPNGCGKSNIIDAIRWVMGEQNARNLRGRAMEDVIFAGSESRRPLGMAEVSLLFDNSRGAGPPAFRDYAEIAVTRRLHRSGESEYLINQTPCRLLDVAELFMDTGVGARTYSIVEQGKIGMILNAKPEERRFLIEEAAGVSKFKSRKKSALRKIEATRNNLLRLGDITTEVRRQMNSLKRQAQRAERFRTFREELREIEALIAWRRFRALTDRRRLVEELERERSAGLEKAGAGLEARRLELERLRLEQSVLEKEAASRQEAFFRLTADIEKREGEIELARRETERLEKQQHRLAAEEEGAGRQLAALDGEEEGLHRTLAGLAEELREEEEALSVDQERLAGLSTRENGLGQRLEEARRDLLNLLTDLSRLGSRQEEIERQSRSLEERTARNRAEATGVRERLEALQHQIDSGRSGLAGIRSEHSGLARRREELEGSLRSLRQRLEKNEQALLVERETAHRLRSRLESLRQLAQNLEGCQGGVKLLLQSGEFRTRLGGMVADALEVPVHYEAALEAVLGDRLQNLLVDDPATAREAGALLASREGRCTFLLPSSSSQAPDFAGGELLSRLIGAAPGRAGQVGNLLAGVYLVEDLGPHLDRPLPSGITLVTPEGEMLNARGELTLGARGALDRGLLARKREVKELAEQSADRDQAVARLQEERKALRQELEDEEGRLRETQGELHRKELHVVDREKDLERLLAEVERQEDRLEVLSLEEDQLHGEQEALGRQRRSVTDEWQRREAERSSREQAVAALQEDLSGVQEEAALAREEVTNRRITLAGIKEREEAARRSFGQLDARRRELATRCASLGREQEEARKEAGQLEEKRLTLGREREGLLQRLELARESSAAARRNHETGSEAISAQEEHVQREQSGADRLREELGKAQLELRELQLEIDHLRESLLEKYRLDLADFRPTLEEEPDWDRLEARRTQLQRLIEEVGEVNLTAIEEFQELEARYRFLSGQKEDLEQSLQGLQTAITKINRTTRKRFRETFDQVNGKFQEVFPRLFRGGRGELRLTDEQDLLETGIEIIVQPPGKKLQNVTLLSGGEKALAAVALIFAVFLCKPSPFCILDEVDAPLDDVNIGRFNDMVREMASLSQFIIVTHNKRTMEIADTLYGVTMEEPGVSKLVSVRLSPFAAQPAHAV